MRRKLWPNALAKEGALGQMLNKFQVYFINIIFFNETNKKKLQYIESKSYTAMLLYLFSDSLLSTCPKKWKLKNGWRQPTLPCIIYSIKKSAFISCIPRKDSIIRKILFYSEFSKSRCFFFQIYSQHVDAFLQEDRMKNVYKFRAIELTGFETHSPFSPSAYYHVYLSLEYIFFLGFFSFVWPGWDIYRRKLAGDIRRETIARLSSYIVRARSFGKFFDQWKSLKPTLLYVYIYVSITGCTRIYIYLDISRLNISEYFTIRFKVTFFRVWDQYRRCEL